MTSRLFRGCAVVIVLLAVLTAGSVFASAVQTYTVNYDASPATQKYSPVAAEHGKKLAQPANPRYTNHTFTGWYTEDSIPWDFEQDVVTSDMTLYAGWRINEYNLRFFTGYGDNTLIEALTVEYGGSYTMPASPSRPGYSFTGWFKENGEPWDRYDFIAKDWDIFAGWEEYLPTVSYYAGPKESVCFTSAKIPYGSAAPIHEPPVKEGFTLEGWQTANGAIWEFSTPVYEDLKLYAVWAPIQSQITYMLNEREQYLSQDVPYGQNATEPDDPLQTGYSFKGWYTTDNKPWDFSQPVYENIVLYAHWDKLTLPVLFLLDNSGGEAYETQNILYGETAAIPAAPEREGFHFAGWYTAEGTQWDFTRPITNTATLYARWDTVFLKVDFYVESKLHDSQQVAYGSNAAPPEEPSREGYTFTGWYTQEQTAAQTAYNFTQPVLQNMDLFDGWAQTVPPGQPEPDSTSTISKPESTRESENSKVPGAAEPTSNSAESQTGGIGHQSTSHPSSQPSGAASESGEVAIMDDSAEEEKSTSSPSAAAAAGANDNNSQNPPEEKGGTIPIPLAVAVPSTASFVAGRALSKVSLRRKRIKRLSAQRGPQSSWGPG